MADHPSDGKGLERGSGAEYCVPGQGRLLRWNAGADCRPEEDSQGHRYESGGICTEMDSGDSGRTDPQTAGDPGREKSVPLPWQPWMQTPR